MAADRLRAIGDGTGVGAARCDPYEIGRLIGNHLAATPTPRRVLTEPGIVPRVRANRNDRVPDLAIACSPPGNEVVVPVPTVLIEILSPSNEAPTRAKIGSAWAIRFRRLRTA